VLKRVVPEGFRAAQIYARAAELTGLPVADFEAAATQTDELGLPKAAGGAIEGWLYPATYEYAPGTGAIDILKPMVAKTVEVLEEIGVEEKDWQDTLILASMIEKESKLDEDRQKVSQVFHTRLKDGMKLQSDATVAYGVQEFDSVYSSNEALKDDNEWNTYVHKGLPGTPICSPGEPSIEAAINPAPTDYLYFVVVNLDTGETVFSETAEEHAVAVEQLAQWERDNPSSTDE
jgi:UPF0755 protein